MQLAVFVWLTMTLSAQAASFDCGMAGTKVEHIICDNQEISKLDEELSAAYKTAVQDKQKTDTVKQAQKGWMKERNLCSDADCLEMNYRGRLDELNPGHGRFATLLAKDKPLCDAYKRYVEHEAATKNQYVHYASPMCQRAFGEAFPEFAPVKWREVKPEDYPELAVEAYRYINFWPWDRPGVIHNLADNQFQGQLNLIKRNHSNNGWHMWLGEADIGNTGRAETLLRVEEGGRCGEESMTGRPPRWSIPVMVVDASGKKIDTAKSEWILEVTVRSHTSPLPPNIKEASGLHSIMNSSLDIFGFSRKIFFDRWEDEWALPHSFLADQRYSELTVYTISQEKAEAICRFKFNKQAN
jgi:uncharacterized protein YecT (DUF1311 family)